MSDLDNTVMEELREQGYEYIDEKEFAENYESEAYILLRKDGIYLLAYFSYCSCYYLGDETTSSIISSATPLTDECIQEIKDSMYIEKEEQSKYLDELGRMAKK